MWLCLLACAVHGTRVVTASGMALSMFGLVPGLLVAWSGPQQAISRHPIALEPSTRAPEPTKSIPEVVYEKFLELEFSPQTSTVVSPGGWALERGTTDAWATPRSEIWRDYVALKARLVNLPGHHN